MSVPLSILLGTSGGIGLTDRLRFAPTPSPNSALRGDRRPPRSSKDLCERSAPEALSLPLYGELGSPFAREPEEGVEPAPKAGGDASFATLRLSDRCGKKFSGAPFPAGGLVDIAGIGAVCERIAIGALRGEAGLSGFSSSVFVKYSRNGEVTLGDSLPPWPLVGDWALLNVPEGAEPGTDPLGDAEGAVPGRLRFRYCVIFEASSCRPGLTEERFSRFFVTLRPATPPVVGWRCDGQFSS